MKLSKETLMQIIKEELTALLGEEEHNLAPTHVAEVNANMRKELAEKGFESDYVRDPYVARDGDGFLDIDPSQGQEFTVEYKLKFNEQEMVNAIQTYKSAKDNVDGEDYFMAISEVD